MIILSYFMAVFHPDKISSFIVKFLPWLVLISSNYLFCTRSGCIVLLYGQSKFHEEATRTLDFVVNQSDFTIQSLRNVTEYLSFAKTITVAALYLPSDVQGQIDSLKGDLNKAADTISQKTAENYKRIRKVLHIMYVWELLFH